MSTPDDQNWFMTPYPEIFEKIMMTIGLSSLESLHRCRQVCRTWNSKIMENIWGSPRNRNIMKIEKNWGHDILPSEEEISHAKWLGTYIL